MIDPSASAGAAGRPDMSIQPPNMETVAPGVHVLRGPLGGVANAIAVETQFGVVQVDTGSTRGTAREMLAALRTATSAPVCAIVYSHGHLGFNDAVPVWLDDAATRGDPPPRLIAHENLVRRWRRFKETEALQRFFVELQFHLPVGSMQRPLPLTMPTETYTDALTLGTAARRVQVLWAPSETDDASALWIPDVKVLFGGSAVIMSIPNVGSPLRSLRDPVRWANTLDRLASLDPEILVPESGPPLRGHDEVQQVLGTTAAALRWLREQVVRRLNRGMNAVEIVHDLDYPSGLFGHPWMVPSYGHPEYIVRDIVRAETGWWDRNPTNLHPAHPDEAGAAVCSAIADKASVLARARSLAEAGKHQLALHVIDILALAPGDDAEVAEARRLKAELCRALAAANPSIVSTGLYLSAADIIERGADRPTGIR